MKTNNLQVVPISSGRRESDNEFIDRISKRSQGQTTHLSVVPASCGRQESDNEFIDRILKRSQGQGDQLFSISRKSSSSDHHQFF